MRSIHWYDGFEQMHIDAQFAYITKYTYPPPNCFADGNEFMANADEWIFEIVFVIIKTFLVCWVQ